MIQPTGVALVAASRQYLGVPYLYGGKTSAGLDCSGLIFLALANLGVPFVHGSTAQIEACEPIGVEEGWATPGALLWREGHDAISTGSGTVEAIRPAVSELGRSDTYDGGKVRFTRAGLIPGIDYTGGDMAAVPMPVITTKFGRETPVTGRHRGLDLRSRLGDPVLSIFDGTVVDVVRGRPHGAPVGKSIGGIGPLSGVMSGNGPKIRLDDGSYYFEVHLDPAVRLKVGDRVKAFETVLGHTDLSGQVYGAHRHVELWRSDSSSSYYDPTERVTNAYANSGKASAPDPSPNPQEDDDMTPEQAKTLELLVQQNAQALNDIKALNERLDALPNQIWSYRDPKVTPDHAYRHLLQNRSQADNIRRVVQEIVTRLRKG